MKHRLYVRAGVKLKENREMLIRSVPLSFLIPIATIPTSPVFFPQRLSPQFLLMRLKHAATAQEDLSENLASSFVLQGSSGANTPGTGTGPDHVDQFVKEFKEMRKVYHKRMIWADRWASGKVGWRED